MTSAPKDDGVNKAERAFHKDKLGAEPPRIPLGSVQLLETTSRGCAATLGPAKDSVVVDGREATIQTISQASKDKEGGNFCAPLLNNIFVRKKSNAETSGTSLLDGLQSSNQKIF